MNKIAIAIIVLALPVFGHSQTRIGTKEPVSSAILELNSTDKGFKGPDIALSSHLDQSLTPERGLIVFNTANAGTNQNQVYANRYYFWNGSEWVSLPGYTAVEELIVPRVFYAKSTLQQSFASDTQQLILNVENTDINILNILTPMSEILLELIKAECMSCHLL